MGVQVIVGQGWPHGEERFGRWSGEERKDLEGGQEASKVLKPADFDLHSISNGKPWKASEQDMGNSTLGLSLLVLIHPTLYAAWLPGQAVSSSWYGLLSTRPGCAGPPLCPLRASHPPRSGNSLLLHQQAYLLPWPQILIVLFVCIPDKLRVSCPVAQGTTKAGNNRAGCLAEPLPPSEPHPPGMVSFTS